MELKIFTTFKTIVRTGSFTKAARLLSYTPSTITFHVAQLETQLHTINDYIPRCAAGKARGGTAF